MAPAHGLRAELFEAQRSGYILAAGEMGQKPNELFPGLYPKKS
jgi:hypothetical protein